MSIGKTYDEMNSQQRKDVRQQAYDETLAEWKKEKPYKYEKLEEAAEEELGFRWCDIDFSPDANYREEISPTLHRSSEYQGVVETARHFAWDWIDKVGEIMED